MTASEYCAVRARWWRDEIAAMPSTPPHVVAEAQAMFAAVCDEPDEAGDAAMSNFERIAAKWARAASRAP